jgi:hypothetical protein
VLAARQNRPDDMITIIEILWEGPFKLDDVKKFNSKTDYGVY